MILFSETAPLQIGDPSDETVLVDVIAFDPSLNLRVGDTLWATGSGVSEGVERGFLAYHSGGGMVAKASVTEPAERVKRKYTRRVPLATAAVDARARSGQ